MYIWLYGILRELPRACPYRSLKGQIPLWAIAPAYRCSCITRKAVALMSGGCSCCTACWWCLVSRMRRVCWDLASCWMHRAWRNAKIGTSACCLVFGILISSLCWDHWCSCVWSWAWWRGCWEMWDAPGFGHMLAALCGVLLLLMPECETSPFSKQLLIFPFQEPFQACFVWTLALRENKRGSNFFLFLII